jgi:hypothetical protein
MAGEAWANATHSATRQSTARGICKQQTCEVACVEEWRQLLVTAEDLINLWPQFHSNNKKVEMALRGRLQTQEPDFYGDEMWCKYGTNASLW